MSALPPASERQKQDDACDTAAACLRVGSVLPFDARRHAGVYLPTQDYLIHQYKKSSGCFHPDSHCYKWSQLADQANVSAKDSGGCQM